MTSRAPLNPVRSPNCNRRTNVSTNCSACDVGGETTTKQQHNFDNYSDNAVSNENSGALPISIATTTTTSSSKTINAPQTRKDRALTSITPSSGKDYIPEQQQQQQQNQEEVTTTTSLESEEKAVDINNTNSEKPVTDEQIAAAVKKINDKRDEDSNLVDTTVSRWKEEAASSSQNIAENCIQTLLESYARLVVAKRFTALERSAHAETRLMECADVRSNVLSSSLSSSSNQNDYEQQELPAASSPVASPPPAPRIEQAKNIPQQPKQQQQQQQPPKDSFGWTSDDEEETIVVPPHPSMK